MSRAGKHPLNIPTGVSIEKTDKVLTIKGPKGVMTLDLTNKHSHLVSLEISEKEIKVVPLNELDQASRAMWGTMARLIKSAIDGVVSGFSKKMGMKGVGYRASVSGNKLTLVVGYSHDVVVDIPEGLSVEVSAPTEFTISGIDKQQVGQFADKIRKIRLPEPYKGKGIFYADETIRRKEGKKK